MAKKREVYICGECGYETPKWLGRCPSCGTWNSFTAVSPLGGESSALSRSRAQAAKPAPVSPITADAGADEIRYRTGMPELDRVLGGGLVKGSVLLIGGEPGIGKSTLLLQICQKLGEDVISYLKDRYGEDCDKTFKVHAKRARKTYPMASMEMNAELGARILDAFPKMQVDVHKPELMLHVEIREKIYLYSDVIPGPGGMPVGTNGKSMLLLSGGIDSPVAGYMVAKRGVKIDAVYFHAPPYTSERAKQKVVDLAEKVSRFTGPIYLYVVNFTEIQLYIYEKCPHDELTIIMRRYMMRIAERIAEKTGSLGLITGESIGQVASQTVPSLAATNEVCTMPVFRPLIAFDKEDIVTISKQIDTYETSIQPFEDCCTIFVAKHPVTKPNLNVIRKHEKNLDEKIDELVQTALDTKELIVVEA